jgi:hypothetical protein
VITGLIVVASIVFGVVFILAWLVRPDLRAWIEQPKYRFQDSVRRYDDEAGGGRSASGRSRSS